MFNSFSNLFRNLPPVTKNLIIINVIIWLFMQVCGPSTNAFIHNNLALHYFSASDFNGVQLVSYMFLHAGFFHVFFNMFTLLMFGIALERSMGSVRFLFYYLTCGIGAALVQEGVWALTWFDTWSKELAIYNHTDVSVIRNAIEQAMSMGEPLPFLNSMITVGASGAVFGVLLAFAMIYPNLPTYIMFIPYPIKAKWMVLGYGAIELFLALSVPGSTVAHFAHLGGMIFGFLLILYWKKRGDIHVIY